MLKVNAKKLGNVTVFCLQGHMVNGETAPLLEAAKAESRASTVVLDLARVSAIDAAGLGVMLEVRRQLQAKGIRLKLMNASKSAMSVLEVTRLDSVFDIMPTTNFAPPLSGRRARGAIPFAACA